MWGGTADELVAVGVRVATSWDLFAAQRVLDGGWRLDAGRVWARLHGLDQAAVPVEAPVDLFSSMEEVDDSDPVDESGHLRASWTAGGWAADDRIGRWAALALDCFVIQMDRLQAVGARAPAMARSESTAELLCAELRVDGLPIDRVVAEGLIASFIGPRPRNETEADIARGERDALVLQHAPTGVRADLRNPAQVKSLLRSVGVDLPDTRAWRLEAITDPPPLVSALLEWRKAERVATTFGYTWLDEHLGADGRLHGDWSASDGAAGRMTATAGLHNMPAFMREAVIAEPGHVFVRADLGQIEPRVLAAVSGDATLAAATVSDDLYAPVAEQLGVDRATAKVAVLGAMYGQTTGHGAQALRGLERAYPVAMQYLADADLAGQVGRELRTWGGRLIRMGSTSVDEMSDRDARSRAAARGRYGRNAMVQGAAAELFKVWAVTMRARSAPMRARIVLCLHDELLIHVPAEHGEAAAALLVDCLGEAAHRWAPNSGVRFIADVSVIDRWSDAK